MCYIALNSISTKGDNSQLFNFQLWLKLPILLVYLQNMNNNNKKTPKTCKSTVFKKNLINSI